MSMSTTLPPRSAGVSGRELIHSPPMLNAGSLPSIGSGTEDVIIGFMGILQSPGARTAARAGLVSATARNSRTAFMTSRWCAPSRRPSLEHSLAHGLECRTQLLGEEL